MTGYRDTDMQLGGSWPNMNISRSGGLVGKTTVAGIALEPIKRTCGLRIVILDAYIAGKGGG